MAGYYVDANKYQISSWFLGCVEKEIDYHVQAEQERIIKLLGIWDCNNDRCDCDSINECVYRQKLIALIKGEK